MVRLSVNVNKVATLRNSRGGAVPSVHRRRARRSSRRARRGSPCIRAPTRVTSRGGTSSTSRRSLAEMATPVRTERRRAGTRALEFNIEGDPRPDLMALVHEVRPDQCTLVPVLASEVTSQGRWPAEQAGRAAAADDRRPARRRHPGQRVHRSRRRAGALGRRHRRGSRRALHRAVRARLRPRARPRGARGASTSASARPKRRTGSASASTPGTTSTTRTSPCSARCRTWTRCRSATRSSAGRFFDGLDATVREYLAVLA